MVEAELVRPGMRIRHYELIRELGRGGMGRVFLARDTKLGRRVAMKFLFGDTPGFTERILAEARATARCNHENIVILYEADEYRGRPYLVLEHLEGETLARTIGRRCTSPRAVELIVPVLRALARAHEFGIVHRDLKPENIFLTTAGAVKVLDFGIAKVFSPAGFADGEPAAVIDSVLTRESLPAGTIPYMAPEQLRFDVDHRSDLWAVGVILYELLAGRHPFAELGPDALFDHLMDLEAPVPSIKSAVEVPDDLAYAIDRCLAKQKSQRFGDARQLLAALEPLLPRRFGVARTSDASPYPGLTAFEESDADRFFGRVVETARFVSRLRDQPITAVVGPSGTGKSSFIRAGVIPALRASGETWEILVLRPGRHPISSLAGLIVRLTARDQTPSHDALVERMTAEPGALGAILRTRAIERNSRIVLFVDQFEELYALGAETSERLAFTASLSGMADDAAAPLRLLVSMRSDFLDRAAEDRTFAEDLARGLVLLQPLGREALREALVRPLEQVDHRFETTQLVTDMLDALATTPGALPLLQFAASKLWEGRDRQRKLLTVDAYAKIGGVAGALAAHADQVLAALTPPGQRLARTLLTRLVTLEGTRASVEMAELEQMASDTGEVRRIVDQLASSRLLVVQPRGEREGAAVELIHESLIAGWPTLRRWLDDGKEDAAFLAELRAAAQRWDAKGRRADLLWRGEAAQEARRFRARFRGELAARESRFLDAVFALAGRAARIRRAIIGGVIGVLLAIVGAGAIALISIRRANRDALDQAAHAQLEAERARAAEQRVKDQLSLIENEQRAKERARAEVDQRKEELKHVNSALEQALSVAQTESKHARDEATHARELADSLQRANTKLSNTNDRLEGLLAQERARAEKLEQERKKISTHLK